jgi:hypothetical protein
MPRANRTLGTGKKRDQSPVNGLQHKYTTEKQPHAQAYQPRDPSATLIRADTDASRHYSVCCLFHVHIPTNARKPG